MKKSVKIVILLIMSVALVGLSIWNYSGSGGQGFAKLDNKKIQPIEPAIKFSSEAVSTSAIVGASQQVVIINLEAGREDITVKEFRVKCTGTYSTNAGANNNEFKIYADDVLVHISTATDCTAGAGYRMDLQRPLLIRAGETSQFDVWYDTTAEAGQAAGESMQFVVKISAGRPDKFKIYSVNGPVLTY